MNPNQELMLTEDASVALAYPVEVVPQMFAERLLGMVERALQFPAIDDASQERASQQSAHLHAAISVQEQRVTELRRPLRELADKISAESKISMQYAVRATAELDEKILHFLKEKREKEEAERREAVKAAAEAQAKREAAEREIQRLSREAEQKREEAERKRFESEERERIAAAMLVQEERTLESVATSTAALESSALLAAAAADAEEEAQRLERDAKELQAIAAVQKMNDAEELTVHVPEIIGSTVAKIKEVPFIDAVDLHLLPLDYHVADESKIKKALGMGLSIPGVTWHLVGELKAARRKS